MALLAKAWHWEAVEGLEVSLPEGSLLPHCGCQLTATAPACQRASLLPCSPPWGSRTRPLTLYAPINSSFYKLP